MKALEFKEYTAPYADGDGDEHESTIRAAIIGPEDVYLEDPNGNRSRRELMTITGARQVSEGDVFVEGERAGEYDYLTAAQWAATGYSDGTEADSETDEEAADDSAADSTGEPKRAPAKKAAAKRTLPSDNGS